MPKPPRIGIDARMFRKSTGGIGRYSRELLRELLPLAEDIEFKVFVTKQDRDEWDLPLHKAELILSSSLHYSLGEQTDFLKQLTHANLDLVHFLNFNHPIRYRGKFVVTLHDLTLLLFPGHGGKKPNPVKQLAFRQIFMHALQKSERVIAISEYTAKDVVSKLGVSPDKIEMIYEGGPDLKTDFSDEHREVIRAYLKFEEPYFLFLSNWRPHKGVATLIEAFEHFKRESKMPHKLVIGGNPDGAPPAVRSAIDTSKHKADIMTPGFAPESLLPSLFHFAEAFVFPSEYEGFGLPILEALAFGTPVIASDNSSLPEVVGDAGFLFPTKNSVALARQMVELASFPQVRQNLVDKGPQQLSKFSWNQCAVETLAVYRQVLKP